MAKGIAPRLGFGNCLFWAITMWLTRGGYIVMRWSHWRLLKVIKFPHFLWCRSFDHVYSFSPRNPKNKLLPHFVFRGKIIREK